MFNQFFLLKVRFYFIYLSICLSICLCIYNIDNIYIIYIYIYVYIYSRNLTLTHKYMYICFPQNYLKHFGLEMLLVYRVLAHFEPKIHKSFWTITSFHVPNCSIFSIFSQSTFHKRIETFWPEKNQTKFEKVLNYIRYLCIIVVKWSNTFILLTTDV